MRKGYSFSFDEGLLLTDSEKRRIRHSVLNGGIYSDERKELRGAVMSQYRFRVHAELGETLMLYGRDIEIGRAPW